MALAGDIPRLRAVQAHVRRQRLEAPLFNTQLLVRNLERAYYLMYKAFEEGTMRRHIYVPKKL